MTYNHNTERLGNFDYDPDMFRLKPCGNKNEKYLVYTGKETDGRMISIPEGIKDISFMFKGTEITSVPVIPDSVETAVYAFCNCQNIKTAGIKARNLKKADNMFSGCIKMTHIYMKLPELKSGVGMFQFCTLLEYTEPLPKSLVYADDMFYNCCSLMEQHDLKLTGIATSANMYYGCRSLKKIRSMPHTVYSADGMFMKSGLEWMPDLSVCNRLITGNNMFAECIYLEKPNRLPRSIRQAAGMFRSSGLRKAPDLSETHLWHCNDMFMNCARLKSYKNLPHEIISATDMFKNCPVLDTVPDLSGYRRLENMDRMYYGCISLKDVKSLPPNVRKAVSAFEMTALKKTPPMRLLAEMKDCRRMYAGCRNLTEVTDYPPSLNAVMQNMYEDCKNLSILPENEMPTACRIDEMMDRMQKLFSGCISLNAEALRFSYRTPYADEDYRQKLKAHEILSGTKGSYRLFS